MVMITFVKLLNNSHFQSNLTRECRQQNYGVWQSIANFKGIIFVTLMRI